MISIHTTNNMNIMKINSTGQELENRTQEGRRGEILHTLKNKIVKLRTKI